MASHEGAAGEGFYCMIHCVSQVTAHGGPQPQSTIEFSIEDTDIATISNSGLVESQLVGVTTVIGRAVGYEGDTGKSIIYSQVRYRLMLWPGDLQHQFISCYILYMTDVFLLYLTWRK